MKGRIERGIRWSRHVVAPPILIALFVVALASPAWAGGGNVTLIINAEDKAGVPRNYRSTSAKLDGDHLSAAGLEKLRASERGAARRGARWQLRARVRH